MKKQNIFEYYAFGYDYYLLRFRSKESTNKTIIGIIERFFDKLDELGLIVTKKTAGDLKKILEELREKDPNTRCSTDFADKINKTVDKLDVTLDAELQLKEVYTLTEKRFELNKLLNNTERLFGKTVFDEIPSIAKYDFKEAGKCIAFARSTAAAFHLLRGTESVLRKFYCGFVKNRRVKPLLWGNMIKHLRQRRKKLPPALLNNLDNIRDSFRNPTNHPDLIYNIEEAQDLFGLCIEVVNRMIGMMNQKKK